MADGATELGAARELSPLRKTTSAASVDALVREQLAHFSLDPDSPLGRELAQVAGHVYRANQAMHGLWDATVARIAALDRRDRIAFWNAKRFLCFQLAKLLDTLQNPMRKSWQSLVVEQGASAQRGPYALFDNVTAIFSSTPVIARTATYLYACTEWIDDAFQGRELLHEIYSRLMNPTSVCLANYIVDVEAGPLAGEYFAWNFNSGMAAIDAVLAHLVGYRDMVLSSRNVYGGAHQLLHDWYGKRSNLDVAVETFDGFLARDFELALAQLRVVHADRIAQGRQIYVYLESPCNPHGYVLDVAAICRSAHREGLLVICDSTVGTPFLHPVLRRADPAERPDFVLHSYTKDLVGTGTATAGVAIARNERMFLPKGSRARLPAAAGGGEIDWSETLFWNVYYVKGAFLDADKAFEVINGMRTLELRMLQKCITTETLARARAPPRDPRELERGAGQRERGSARARDVPRAVGAAVHDRVRAGGRLGIRAADRRVQALLRLPRAGVRAAGEPRPGEHGRALSGADESLRALSRGAARRRHLAHDHPHRGGRRRPARAARPLPARRGARARPGAPRLLGALPGRRRGRRAVPRGLPRDAPPLRRLAAADGGAAALKRKGGRRVHRRPPGRASLDE